MVIIALIILSAIWVYIDARRIGVKKDQINGLFNMGPVGWALVTLLLWIIGFPSYLYKRNEYKKINNYNSDANVSKTSQRLDEESLAAQYLSTRIIEKILVNLKNGYFINFTESNVALFTKIGLLGLYVVGFLGFLLSFVIPILMGASFLTSVAMGLGWLVLSLIAQYIATKFIPAIASIIKATPTSISTSAWLDSIALLAGIAGLLGLFNGLYEALNVKEISPLIEGIFLFIFCEYMVAISLSPKVVNVEVLETGSAGKDFTGILSFIMKSLLILVPVFFGTGILLGILDIINFIGLFFDDALYPDELMARIFDIVSILWVAFLPIAAYMFFIAYYFFIDMANSILSLTSDNKIVSKDIGSNEKKGETDISSMIDLTSDNVSKVKLKSDKEINLDKSITANKDKPVSNVYDQNKIDEMFSKGRAEFKIGRYNEAVETFTKIISLDNKNAKAYYYRSVTYKRLNENDKSEADLKISANLGYHRAINSLDSI